MAAKDFGLPDNFNGTKSQALVAAAEGCCGWRPSGGPQAGPMTIEKSGGNISFLQQQMAASPSAMPPGLAFGD